MKTNSIQQTAVLRRTVTMQQETVPRLSEDAFYLLMLACQLRKLLGAASLKHFLATGESVMFTKKAS